MFFTIINDTITLLNKVLRNNRLLTSDINQLVLVGENTYVPQVREQLAKQTGITLNYSVDPTTAQWPWAAAPYYANTNTNHRWPKPMWIY